MLRLKACPRCRGDLHKEQVHKDYFEWTCIQCGRTAEFGGEGLPVAISGKPISYVESGGKVHRHGGHA